MKKIIRLTEGDLARIVRRVINEQVISRAVTDVLKKGLGYQGNIINTSGIKSETEVQKDLDKYMSSYKIKQGDTLGGIASKFGKTLDQLIKLNPGLDDPNKIFTGQTIKVK